jgi:glycosyltransferase involved in cell wall biosynthesis
MPDSDAPTTTTNPTTAPPPPSSVYGAPATAGLPRISIVVPNFNAAATLERTILSLLGQNYPNLQLILVDAGSTDGSRQIIEKYRHAFDKVVIEKDRGQADGINKGFRLADGDIFGWLCSDDELKPGALHHVAATFSEHPDADVISGACDQRFPDGTTYLRLPESDPWAKTNVQCCLEQPSTFWCASLHRRLGELDLSYYLAFDWDWWNRMRKAGARYVAIEPCLSIYYFSDTNKTGSAGNRFAAEAFRIVRKYGPFGGALAYVFRFLYKHFDLHGCYDRPPTCTPARGRAFVWALKVLTPLVGRERLYQYNWHFASLQARGIKWW